MWDYHYTFKHSCSSVVPFKQKLKAIYLRSKTSTSHLKNGKKKILMANVFTSFHSTKVKLFVEL